MTTNQEKEDKKIKEEQKFYGELRNHTFMFLSCVIVFASIFWTEYITRNPKSSFAPSQWIGWIFVGFENLLILGFDISLFIIPCFVIFAILWVYKAFGITDELWRNS